MKASASSLSVGIAAIGVGAHASARKRGQRHTDRGDSFLRLPFVSCWPAGGLHAGAGSDVAQTALKLRQRKRQFYLERCLESALPHCRTDTL